MTFDVRLVAYEPNGVRLGVIRHVARASAAMPMNDVSSLRLDVPVGLPGAEFLESPCEIALEVSRGGDWVEPPNARFLRLQWERNPAVGAETVRVSAPGYAWLLDTAGVEGPDEPYFDGESENGNPNRRFVAATAGTILVTAIHEAQALGLLPGLQIDFTPSVDSTGAPWSKVLPEISYTPGLPIGDVLSNLTDQGLADWRMEGRTLRVFNADSGMSVDRTAGDSPVVLRMGRDVSDAPTRGDLSSLVHRAVVRGEDGQVWTMEGESTVAPWGKFQRVSNQGTVSREATAMQLLDSTLAQGAEELVEMTRELRFESPLYLPVFDYQVGDYVFGPDEHGRRERLRVRQLTLDKSADGRVSGNVVLNDRFLEASLRQSRRMRGIQGGSTVGGGSGAVPADKVADKRVPRAPAYLGADSTAFISESGEPRAVVNLSWAEVTKATDGSTMSIAHYEVAVRDPRFSGTFSTVAEVSGTTFAHGPVEAGIELDFEVRAVAYRTHRKSAAASVTVTTEVDTEPPPVPSEPSVTSHLGTITVRWDGKTSSGTPMPRDFDYARVWQQGVDEPVAALRLTGGEDFEVFTGLPYGVPVRFRLTAVDLSGNESEPTAWVEGVPQGVLDGDLAGTAMAQAVQQLDEATQELDGRLGAALSDLSDAQAQIDGLEGEVALAATTAAVENLYVSGSATIAEAVVDKIWASKIAARKVLANEVLIGGESNAIQDPSFGQEGAPYWQASGGFLSNTDDWWVSGFKSELFYATAFWAQPLQVTYGGEGLLPCNPGESWALRFQKIRSSTSVENRFDTTVFFYDAAGDLLSSSSVESHTGVPGNGWGVHRFEVPASASEMRFAFNIDCSNIDEWEAVCGFLRPTLTRMVDYNLVVDGGIAARHIASGAVTTDALDAGVVTTVKLAANAISAEKLAANAITSKHTITGALIQTTSTANRGVKINSSGIQAYNSSGTRTFYVNASNGQVQLATAASGRRIRIGEVAFKSGTAANSLVFWEQAGNAGGLYAYTVSGTTNRMLGIASGGTSCFIELNSAGNGVLSSANGWQYFGSFGPTSSLRYKEDVAPVPLQKARGLLEVPAVTFRYSRDVQEGNPTLRLGVIAEELHEAGLEEAVVYDSDGLPDSVDIGALVSLILPLLSDIDRRVGVLEGAGV